MLVIVAPGQGAQSPGFLEPWLAANGFAAQIEQLSAVTELDLAHYGTAADADTIRDTAIAQPLLVASAVSASSELFSTSPDVLGQVGAVAGHSVGEVAAAAIAGILAPEQAMIFVRERGRLMAEAAGATPTSMTAVLGGDRDAVMAALESFGLTPANNNGPGQIVAAGTVEQLQALLAAPPEGTRLVPLSVAGAFHTHHMAPAVERLEVLSRDIATHDTAIPLISNRDGRPVSDGADVLQRLVNQVSSPVRWDLCMDTMAEMGVTGMLELPPAGTLTGIARRALKGVETFALKTPDQLDDARQFVELHASHQEGAPE